MANKNNVKINNKNTQIKNQQSDERKQKKLRLHSHLKVNIPLFQSLMMILPSLAKHVDASEGSDDLSDEKELATTSSITNKNIVDHHAKTASLEAAHQSNPTNENHASAHSDVNQALHETSTHLVPSHHLSTLSHPQVHYIPSVSIPTISAGSHGQPTHSNTPPTPTSPVTFIPEVIKGTYGELHVDVNGQYTFVLNPKSPQYILLNQHQRGTDHFVLHLSNGSSIIVQIPVTGQQDTPSISGDLTGVVTEDHNIDSQGLLHANGKIDVIDPDQGESSVKPDVIPGNYGVLTIDADGHWQYQVNNSLSNVQALTGATSLHESFTIYTKDGTPQTIDMTIGGNDDNAVITGVDAGSVIEDLTTQVQGQLSVADPDLEEDHFQASQVNSHLGTLTITKDGSWTYVLDNTNPTVQALGKGSTATDTITVHSADGTPHQITVTINGTNDHPIVSGTSSGAVIEQGLNTAGTPDATGSLIATDIDKSDTITWAVNQPQGQWGTLSIDPHGHWHYQLDNSTGSAADKLAAGEHRSESFWITATDSAGATVPHKVVIDVQGSNDKPIVSAWTQLPGGKEDQPITIKASDLLTHASDVDSSDVLHVTNLQATHGSLTDNKDGTYTFKPDKDFNGEIRLTYDVVDGHGGSVSTQAKFDLTAAPDNAMITDAQTNADLRGVTEDRGYIDTHYQLHYDGKLNIQDPDAGEAQFDPNIGPQTYQGIGYDTKLGGHILLMRDGHYTYTLDNRNIQNLAQGEVKHDSAVIRSADGTTHTIELTVHGTNDAPTINAQSHSVTEGGSVLNGQMVGHDIDTGATLTYSAPQVDGLVVNPDGSYSFNPAHSSYQSLASGVTKTLTVPVTVTDEHNASSTQNLSITITGVNNSAVIGGVDTGDVTEGNAGQNMSPDYAQPGMAHLVRSTIDASGKLTIADIDAGEAEFDTHGLGFHYSGQYGDLLLRQDGTWFYHADTGQIRSTGGLASPRGTTIDQLGEHQTLTDTITVYSKDGTSHDIVITIHGSNDRPYCASEVQLHSGKEDLAQTITATELLANTIDVDANDAGKLTIANLHADHGSIRDNQDGTYTFTPDKDYNGRVHFTYDVADAHGGITHTGATMNLVAVADAATITGTDTGSITEDRHVSPDSWHHIQVTGSLSVSDPDASEDHFRATSAFGHERAISDPFQGEMRINQYGYWDYVLANGNPAVQALKQGETKDVIYEVYSADGTPHHITITVTGTNDAPTVSSTVTLAAGNEDTAVLLHASDLLAHASDVDHGAQLSIHNLSADHGQITDNHDGTFRFTPDKDYNGPVQFNYQVQDEQGASVSQTASMDLSAVGDAALITGSGSTLKEDVNLGTAPGERGKLQAYGQLIVVDPDGPAESGFEDPLTAGLYKGSLGGSLQVNPDGQYMYSLGNFRVDYLKEGDVARDRFTVHSLDGTTHTLEFEIQGTNDAPYIRGNLHHAVWEDETVLHGQLNGTDADAGDQQHLVYSTTAQVAGFHLNADGSYTFDPSDAAYQHLTGRDIWGSAIKIPVTVTDQDGLSSTQNLSISVMGRNDAPVVSADVRLPSGTEDTAVTIRASALLTNATDVDDSETRSLSVSGLRADHGSITDNHDGTYTFTPDPDYNGPVQFSYAVKDRNGASTPAHATLALVPVDDKTQFSGVDHDVATEDVTTHISTHVNIMDAVDWQALQITDVDSPNTHVTVEFAGQQYTWGLGSDLDVTTPYGKFQFHTITSGPHTGEHSWSYIGDNNNVHVQELKHGESLTESIKLIATDGTEFPITVKVRGTEDGVVIDSQSDLGHVVENALTGASVAGSVTAHDTDLHDSVSWTATPKGGVSGQYGSFHLSADGQWHYDVDQSKATKLGDGDEYWEHFTIEAVSTDGSKVSQSVSVVVRGNNDAPVVSGEVTLPSGKEDSSIHITQAQLIANATDVDSNDRGWLHAQNLTADHGSITANSDGSFTFNPDPNYNGSIHFTYDVADRHGGIAHTGANTTLAAVNDAARFKGDDTGSVTEDQNVHPSVQGNYSNKLEAQGHLTAIDPDAGESGFDYHTLISAPSHPNWAPYRSALGGELEIDQQGRWHYYIDNRKSEVQSLGAGETLTDTVTIQSKDGTPHVITLTINGTNDDPVLSVAQTTPTTGTLTETDVDVKDTHTFSVVNSTGQFGSLSVDPDSGAYIYTANGSVAGMSYNAATHTYHGTDVFEVKVADNHGGESSKFITFDTNGHVSVVSGQSPTISTSVPSNPLVTTTQPSLPAGTNTPPNNAVTVDLAASSDTGTSDTDNLTKDSTPTITGHTDIPYSQVTIYDGSTPIGHAVSDGSGQYSVAVSSLSNGDHNLSARALAPSSVLPATSSILPLHVDTVVAPLQVSLTHDTGGNSSDLITSDGSLTITGQETGATVEYSTDNGHTWTSSFTPQQGSNTVSVRQTDIAGNVSASSSLTFTLDNTATAPSVSLTSDSGSSSSDNITNVGDLNVGGIEQGATVEYSTDNGVHWSTQFTPNEGVNNVQVRQTDMAGNVSPSTSLTYTLDTQTDIRVNSAQVDQHGHGMMVQVYLPKDSEVTLLEITSDGGGAPLLVDLKTVQIQGIGSSVSHPDHQYQEFVGIDLSSLPDGNLTIRVAGKDAAGNTVTAQSSAGSNYVLDTTASVSDDTNTAIEDSTIPVSGNLLSNDADATTVTTTGDIQGTYGTFHLSSDGSYTYTLNNQLSVIQQLDSTSSPLVDSIAYTARDNYGNPATAHLAISIQGTDDNHAPVVTAHSVSTDEDTTHTFATAEFGYTDQDGDALHFITISKLPTNGLLLLDGKAVTTNQQISKADLDAGHLTFTPIHNENGMNYANIEFTANDGHQDSASATMILNVNAVNDDPTVGSSFKSSPEDTPLHFTKADFKYSDVDGDAMHHITITNIAHGTLSLNGHNVSVGDDVNAADIPSLVFTPTLNYSSTGLNGLGAVQFTANDGHTDSKEGSIFINIAPVDDPATFNGDSTGQAQEDTHTQTSGTLSVTDPDGTQGFIAVQGGAGIVGSKGYGHAHIDSNGHWTYNLYNNHAIVQQLKQGQTDTETITVQAKDGTTHDIVITITGTNDAPTVSEHTLGTSHSVDEDTNPNTRGVLDINDLDGDAVSVTVDPSQSAQFGSVQFDSQTNTWAYHLDNANPQVDALNDGDTLTDKFTLLVDDGHGGKVSKQIVMAINGHTDPIPYTPPTISVTVDTRNAHHVTAGITASTVQAYAHSIGQSARTVSGHHEIEGHGQSEIYIVQGSLHDEAELKSGNDILYIGGRLTDEEIEGGSGRDTLILGAYNRNNAPRLHSDKIGNMEIESIENIILGDGTVLKGRLPPNFPLATHDHYEVPVNIQAHLSSSDESVSSIRLTHLQQGLTLQSNGHNINANHDGSYTVPANGHLVVVSTHPISSGHHYFETEVTTHNSVTGVTAITTEDLHGHIQSHVNPPPPPPLPVQHDEPDFSPLDSVQDVAVTLDDSLSAGEPLDNHAQVGHEHSGGAAAYLDALGIQPNASPTTGHDQPADMDIVLAQVGQQHAVDYDQTHLDMSDALEHHDASNNHNHNQDDEHHRHNDVDGLPDIDPNN
ncbi:VCBS domain-containing protein [Vibrio europaeus]|uniref:VCBS domain-containing protein n=1 Tax=Vibrio europaeus TaxID=300876 RepID=UPI00233F512A|nr:VCBS domain-containing protein [Vibrio europaeus]MDC5807983.1 VCBS domain-containing protein [Vibrio europaeus]MDC5832772.1 VCBS domain-containing protein [Vibrio europaeus]MDC5835683.1 VCBS domain-containing protein [Vibrio europaeus]